MQSYVERLEKGEAIERSLTAISEEGIESSRNTVPHQERRRQEVLRRRLQCGEKHLQVCRGPPLLVEHWLHTIWFSKIREFGNCPHPIWAVEESGRHFTSSTVFEVPCSWKIWRLVGPWHWAPTRGKYWMEKAEKRKKILKAAQTWSRVPASGAPAEVSEPFTIMLWVLPATRW